MFEKPKKSKGISNKILESLKKNYDFANGVELSMASTDASGNRTYSYHYTTKLPKLEITMANAKRTIAIEVSSVEEYDKKLLYFLYKKAVEI